ncbi:Zinc finger HIT domain-containing protein 3 [Coemansia javaensis]|uniref:Zinc finger HIT domain-containing protein 3 n=1 Tax=Coemansia javaensis TaxID=2761396 RepID=A0A9W8HJM5_9FUNG|nr:Zinc finger HIT domain-containing protein 3 [Coemansia javaensis]
MASKQCTVCDKAAAKYKCPACAAGYCSVACCQAHRARLCDPPPAHSDSRPPPAAAKPADDGDGDGDDEEQKHRLRPEDLQRLDRSARVQVLLADPGARALIEAVRRDPSPLQAIRVLRQRPDFEALAQALLAAASGEDP